MDIYTGEGIHALLRIGTTLCCLSHAHLGDTVRENCDNSAVFWYGVKRFAHSKHFHFDLFLEHQGEKECRDLSQGIDVMISHSSSKQIHPAHIQIH